MGKPVRPILINARAAVRGQITGVERWAREMAHRLPALRPEAYRVAAPHPRLAHRAGHAWEQGVLPAMAAARRAPLIFSPANLAPMAWPRNVVAMHDAVVLRHPEFFSRGYVAWQRVLFARVAKGAIRVITGAEFARQELLEAVDMDPDRIAVIPGGIDERFSPDADAEASCRALGLDRPYVLTVASAGARKNLAALEYVAGRLAPEGIDLVFAGGGHGHLKPGAGLAGARTVGFVPDDLLPGLYAGALAFVLPSFHEGFGLTCLEAMASGIPVVAANRAALPEICGDAALFVEPDDHEQIARAVLAASFEPEVGKRLVAAGRERAKSFSWDRTARAVDALLMDLTGRRGDER